MKLIYLRFVVLTCLLPWLRSAIRVRQIATAATHLRRRIVHLSSSGEMEGGGTFYTVSGDRPSNGNRRATRQVVVGMIQTRLRRRRRKPHRETPSETEGRVNSQRVVPDFGSQRVLSQLILCLRSPILMKIAIWLFIASGS